MKRKGKLFEIIADWDNLSIAANKAYRHKGDSQIVYKFKKQFSKNITSIRNKLLNESIEVGNYNRFIIFEPKKRLICAAPFEQRVIHHAIMNICHQYFEKNLIFDTYASRPNKGGHKAVKRVQEKIGDNKYFAKLDIRKFFDSIDHNILKLKLSRLFKDPRLLMLFERIINSYGNGRGVPIGNLTSQYFANYYLSDLDHYMKEEMKARVYVRYMDDVILMAKEKNHIMKLVKRYICYAHDHLGLEVKPPIVGRTCKGIPFLGYRVFKNDILINGKGKRRFIRNLHKLEILYETYRISDREYSNRLMSSLAYIKFANSYKFRLKVLGINIKEL